MAKPIAFTLTTEQLETLNTALKTDNRGEVQKRGLTIRLLHQGHKPAEVAIMVNLSQPSVYSYWHRYQKQGIAGLSRKVKNQAPRKVTPKFLEALKKALSEPPTAYNYDFAIWTRERLQLHLHQQTGILISLNWLAVKMKELGYVYRRPKHDLTHLQEPEAKAAAKELLEEMKKTSFKTISSSSLWTKPN